ncbi:hypothetical protein ACL02T_32975 [Pseudonocardia sp. RS010]|uniref:hypothetical protein n=1 Tax=Pseudonocardia sp. RS010 TaxID=3385979 RepID=UPI0039A2FD04
MPPTSSRWARVTGLRRDRALLQLLVELAGLASFVIAGFLVGLVAGFLVLGLVLVILGNVPAGR